MYVLQVLNDGNEWELVTKVFLTEWDALTFFHSELNMFRDYAITQVE